MLDQVANLFTYLFVMKSKIREYTMHGKFKFECKIKLLILRTQKLKFIHTACRFNSVSFVRLFFFFSFRSPMIIILINLCDL